MSERRRLSGTNIAVIVVALSAAVVLAPVGVMAATGTLVNITDPYNSSSRARVDSGKVRVGDGSGALTVDGKVRVSDGSGALTVDGTVKTADVNALVYRSPAGGLQCGANSSGIPINGVEPGTLNVSRYRKLRISVESGPMNQTIISGYARSTTSAAGEVIKKSPVFDWTVPANSAGHYIVDNLPSLMDVRVWFCANAKVYVYGIR